MEKGTKPRGRPEIKPYIKRLIASRCFDEQKKPPEERMPPKVLAYEIHKELVQQGEKQPPKPSTIEKRISQHRNHPTSPLDSPWTIGCLGQYDIPPEALPKVMFICEKHFRDFKQHCTIREVLWMARLHKLIDDPIALGQFATSYALHEWLDWVQGVPSDTRNVDLAVIQHMAIRLKIDKRDEYCTDIATHSLTAWVRQHIEAWAREDGKEIEKEQKRIHLAYDRITAQFERRMTTKEAQNER